MQETWFRFRDQDNPLEEELATHSSILAWRIPLKEEPAGLQSMVSEIIRHNLVTKEERFIKDFEHFNCESFKVQLKSQAAIHWLMTISMASVF